LTEANLGKTYLVGSIIGEERANLQLLAEIKIKPNAKVQVVKRNADEVILCVEGKECCLSRGLAANVLLRKTRRTIHAVET
jgi:hypothetical protein